MKVAPLETAQTYPLRGRILRPGYPPEASHFPSDAQSVHFGAFDKDRLICVVSAHPQASDKFSGEGQWRIRGMATEDSYRGKGAGSLVLKELLKWGPAHGVRSFWCNAREGALDFYARHGFTVESALFDIPSVGPHKIMRIVFCE